MTLKSNKGYAINGYTPQQGDMIICNFDPTLGREIQKERPALVVSSSYYHQTTGFCVVCPITSSSNVKPGFVKLSDSHKVKGHINAMQLKFVDFMEKERRVRKVEECTTDEFGLTIQIVSAIFDFEKLIVE
ncbi:type II toxin-antitoxin system PemK/MazF family toxin [Enterococcus rivorum]|uniref:Cell division protein FtsN n=1 Tax=Enterococcus rivorum TaxID=762845 RepID=A0A1E5L0L7_9ENTE|nr:type II toxin-antitoxin system PemK/MazF family toxin [Enterococcus rivorum]MBP2098899.1 mRNA interferase MazF [Enterococcus rivorum]OEH83624.1 cell division protein FtsN [Enterococcus rivorum]